MTCWETNRDGRRARRRVVQEVCAAHIASERRAVRWTGFPRATVRRPEEALLRERIRAHATERPRWGYRRIHILLRREGWRVNRKRVFPTFPIKVPLGAPQGQRRRSQAPRPVRENLTRANER